jgi:integrase
VLYETAERCGAIFAARVEDWSSPRLLVKAEHRKGGKRDRLYTLTDETCELVDAMCRGKSPTDLIFKWDRCYAHIWKRFGDIVQAAGLPGGRRAKFHQLRRCAASHFAARGGNATLLLDHSSPRVTRAYLDPRYADLGTPPCHVLPSLHRDNRPAGGDHSG